MSNEWLSDARKIPGEVMSYVRKMAVRAVVQKGYSPESVGDVLGLSQSSIYDWLRRFREGGYEALDTQYAPGADPMITQEMAQWLKTTVTSKRPEDYGYDGDSWTCDILATTLEQEFGVKVRGPTVNAHLKKMGLSYQNRRWS